MEKIKMIAVDMDGTFLNDEHDYNRERFESLYSQMKNRNIKFVVASGNQYYQLKSFFKGKDKEISYIAENGALVIKENKELFCAEMKMSLVYEVVKFLNQHSSVSYLASGRKTAYIKKSIDQKFKDIAAIYNHELLEVDAFRDFDDKIFKFALIVPADETDEIVGSIQKQFKDRISVVSSGHGSIDIIIPGLHKAHALTILQKEWNISNDEIMVFGDGGNDLEMIKHAKYSYAVDNASTKVKNASKYLALSNNEDGVLDVIERYLSSGEFE